MSRSVYSDREVLALAPEARVESSPLSGLSTLRVGDASILLSDGAAAILKLCNGRNGRRDILAQLRMRGIRSHAHDIQAFLDAACRLQWVTSAIPSIQLTMEALCAD